MLKVDLHIHTVASGHAYNTILEYINRARELNMTMIGISDHGETAPGSLVNNSYFSELKRIPRRVNGIVILRGIEANILPDGSLDVPEKVISRLDYVMAGLHSNGRDIDLGCADNTERVVKALNSGRIKILTHPYLTSRIDFDVKVVAEAACANNVLLELNISTFEFKSDDQRLIENLKIMLEVVNRHGKKIIINSDAHTIWQLADETPLKQLQGIIDLPKELIINNYPEELLKFLGIEDLPEVVIN